MDISKTLFATMVKNARMDRHWTQEELAEKLGVSPTYLGDLERHKGTPSLSLFCKAMRLLNLSADDYVYPNGNSDSSTYKQLLRLLTHCNEHQLQILLATATAMLQPDLKETQWVTAKREDGREDVELKDIPIREGLVPNVVGMGAKDAVYLLESVGLRASLNGMGRVSSQSVSPGSRVSKGQTVSLTLK